MPIITKPEIRQMIPALDTKAGNIILNALWSLSGLGPLNKVYDAIEQYKGPAFAQALLRHEHAEYQIGNSEVLDHLPEGAFIVISNHPYGAIDGVILIDMIGRLRPDIKVMVNQILTYFRSLTPSFIAVNPTTTERKAPTATSLQGVRDSLAHLREGHPLGIFPSGAVSDLKPGEWFKIRDREWQEPAIRLIKKARVPIIPVRFFDRNTLFYYLLGLIDWRVRLLRLPREIINKGGETIRLCLGDIITPEQQAKYTDINDFRAFLRSSVYDMPLPETFELVR